MNGQARTGFFYFYVFGGVRPRLWPDL